jgi:arginine decarboxylase
MISGRGGAHHCLSPEPARVIFHEVAGRLRSRYVPQQDQATIMRLLGYPPEHMAVPLPFERPATPAELRPMALGTVAARRRMRERVARVR